MSITEKPADSGAPAISGNCKDSAWPLTGALWVLRWLVILPLNWIASQIMGSDGGGSVHVIGNPVLLLLLLVVVGPLIETLIECSLPHWVLEQVQKPVHRWLFICISASMMALLHLVSVMAVINSLVTGAFIAYVYAHVAEQGHKQAILHAAVFHGAINFVGWLIIL